MGNKAMLADPRPSWQDPASEASAILGEAEQRSERVLAWLRLGVLIVLVMLQRVFDLHQQRARFRSFIDDLWCRDSLGCPD